MTKAQPSQIEKLQRFMILAVNPERTALMDEELAFSCREFAPADWERLWRLSEKHGVTSLMHANMGEAAGALPATARQTMLGLVLRQRHSSRVQQAGFSEVLQTLADNGITSTVLKGAALCHMIYAAPALRPMSDIDILIPPDQLHKAHDLISGLGMRSSQGDPGNTRPDSMHLAPLSRSSEDVQIMVELHHSLSRRQIPGHRDSDRLSDSGVQFQFGENGPQAHSLAPKEMLWHLCHHLADHCMFSIRLLWMWISEPMRLNTRTR